MTLIDIAEASVFTATYYWPDLDTLQQYPFHLGTDEAEARRGVEDRWGWRSRFQDRGFPESIALWQRGRVVDYYLGPERGWESGHDVLITKKIANDD